MLLASLAAACTTPSGFPGASDRATYRELVGMRGGLEEQHLQRCSEIADPALAADCALAIAHRLGVGKGDPEVYCTSVPSGVHREECAFLAAEVHRKRGNTGAAIAACARSGAFEARCAYHLWQHELVQMPSSWSLVVATRRATAICTDWEARLGDRGVPERGTLPIAGMAPRETFRSLCMTRFFQGRLEPFDVVPIRVCDEQPAVRAECEAAAVDVAFRRARDQVQRLGESCVDLPVDPVPAAAWWTQRLVKFEADSRLTEGVARACPGRDD